ncbi:hypothetical protein L195_g030666, partial [Trifolium pratense]
VNSDVPKFLRKETSFERISEAKTYKRLLSIQKPLKLAAIRSKEESKASDLQKQEA